MKVPYFAKVFLILILFVNLFFSVSAAVSHGASQVLFSDGTNLQERLAEFTAAETDPKVGAITDGSWCAGSGGTVVCDQTPPSSGDPSTWSAYVATQDIQASNFEIQNVNGIRIGSSGTASSWGVYLTGNQYVSGYVRADGGAHIGGSSDPGADNLLVDGNVGIGTTSPAQKLDVNGRIRSSFSGIEFGESTYRVYAEDSAMNFKTGAAGFSWLASAGNSIMNLNEASGLRVSVTQSGSTSVCRTGSPGYFAICSSLKKYKKDIKDLQAGISTVEKLRPVTFTWKQDDMKDLGFIAEEVYEVDPVLIEYNDKGEIEGVKYRQITALLAKAIQEQQDQITQLQSELCKKDSSYEFCRNF